MFQPKEKRSLSRRGSKMIVEMIIGVIGLLGIMLAQSVNYESSQISQLAVQQGKALNSETASVASKVDWLEIIF